MAKPIIGLTAERYEVYQGTTHSQGVLETYINALEQVGGIPILIPSSLTSEDLLATYARLDGVLLPGGSDIAPAHYDAEPHPALGEVDLERDRVEIELARISLNGMKPVLGICRGAQVFNVALGGTLYQDLPSEFPNVMNHMFSITDYLRGHIAHPVQVAEDSFLGQVLGQPIVQVNSRHHQGLKDIAPGLVVVARAPDGVVEGVEKPDHPFALAVQWHPENMQIQPEMKRLFERFIEACKR